jgi:HemK-like putative methylase
LRLSKLKSPTPSKPLKLLDLGTGTGCIPLLLCHTWPGGSVRADGVDLSEDAIQLSAENAVKCGLSVSVAGDLQRVNVFTPILADYTSPTFFDIISPPYDVLTSNPPYISDAEYQELPLSVKEYEDRRALHGGVDGLNFYHAIAHIISRPQILAPDAVIAVEVGHTQAGAVARILREEGKVRDTEIWTDAWDKQRTVIGYT